MKKYFIVLITLLVFIGAHQASALTVSPAKLEINGDPGSVLSGVINLYNEQEKTETFYTSFENFEPGDDSGTPRFVGAESGLATWMTTQESLTLGSLERGEVPFTIQIPADAEPGGYFSALFFGNQPPADEGQVSIGGRIGVLMLLRVNGDIPENGGITDFNTVDNQKIYTMPPIHFEYRFNNTGGDRVVPRGEITIKNMFGSISDSFDANEIEGSVLPASGRKFKPTWGVEPEFSMDFLGSIKHQFKNFKFGYYTADLALGWGVTNQTASAQTSFWMIPWQLLLVIIGGLLLVFACIRAIFHSYKKSILKELQKQQSTHQETEVDTKETTSSKDELDTDDSQKES